MGYKGSMMNASITCGESPRASQKTFNMQSFRRGVFHKFDNYVEGSSFQSLKSVVMWFPHGIHGGRDE